MWKTETVTKLWLTKLWLPKQWFPVHLRVWHLPSTPSAGYFVSTWVYHQLTPSTTLMIWLLSVTTQIQHTNSHFRHQMKHKCIKSHFLPYNLHLIQLGNKHNIKDILANWIHTLLDETLIEAPATSSHSTNPSKLNSVQNFWFQHVKTSSHTPLWPW